MLKTHLKSIEEEKQDCIQAFTDFPSNYAWCCHHMEHWEELIFGFLDRINYILSDKPDDEQALRFRNFRPVKDVEKLKSLREAYYAQVNPLLKAYVAQVKLLREAY